MSVVQAKTFMRPPVMTLASSMSHMVAFADAIPILSTLSARSLRHKVQLVLPLTQFVATLSRHLSWSHFVNLLPLKRLDKHERQAGEEAPIGLSLRAESSPEQVRVFYVVATRATQRLILTMNECGGFGSRLLTT